MRTLVRPWTNRSRKRSNRTAFRSPEYGRAIAVCDLAVLDGGECARQKKEGTDQQFSTALWPAGDLMRIVEVHGRYGSGRADLFVCPD